MSEFDDLFDESNEDEEKFEPDTATIAFLDQQQAEFEGMADEFEGTYGFKHECHCGEDYAAGRVGEITQCYHNMMQEALATCARLQVELREVTGIAKALYEELAKREAGMAEAGEGEVRSEPESEGDDSTTADSSDTPDIESGVRSDTDSVEESRPAPTETGNSTEFFQRDGRDDGKPGTGKLV